MYFKNGGIERRKTPEPQTGWTHPINSAIEEADKTRAPPRAVEWVVLVFCILLISVLGWGGIAWLVNRLLQ